MSAPFDINNAPVCIVAQLWVAEYLNTRESLIRGDKRVPVFGRRRTNIANDIAATIAELGACIYPLPMLPLEFNVELPGVVISKGEIRVRCIENDTLNTDLPNCYELVEAVVRDLHGKRIPPLAQFSEMTLAVDNPVQERPDDQLIVHDVVFHVRGGYAPSFEDQTQS